MTNNRSFYDDCFTCPYPDCILGTGINKVSLAKKTRAIAFAYSGMHPEKIATALNISRSQVDRYLAEKVKERQDYILSKYGEG